MKTLLFAILCITSFSNIYASIVFEVSGELIVNEKSSSPLEISIVTKNETYKLTNKHTFFDGCAEGKYEIVSNMVPHGTYELLKVIDCKVETRSFDFNKSNSDIHIPLCPKIYLPVCGLPKVAKCDGINKCEQEIPKPFLYGNLCELESAGAKIIAPFNCEEF